MPYVVPTFNLSVNIWNWVGSPGAFPPTNPPDVVTMGNLTPGKRQAGTEQNGTSFNMYLLLPRLTDILFNQWDLTGGTAWVECPAGSGRFYTCLQVDDIGKGFPNEHRFALITSLGAWPNPIP